MAAEIPSSALPVDAGTKKKEIYTYQAPWTVYSMAWRKRPEGRFQLAIGSFTEEYANQFHIVQLQRDESSDGNFLKLSSFDHPYPATKVAWAPSKLTGLANNAVDLLATSGDYLRLWNVNADYSIHMKGVLNNNKHTGKRAPPRLGRCGGAATDRGRPFRRRAVCVCVCPTEYCAPLTSFDWNETEPSMIGSCSIDTTCTIWDINVRALAMGRATLWLTLCVRCVCLCR